MQYKMQEVVSSSDERRVITSAIDGMSVAEVRRALATMRRNWEECATAPERGRPFYVSCDILVGNHTVQDFSYKFVQGHHEKRISKNKSALSLSSLDAGSSSSALPCCSARA